MARSLLLLACTLALMFFGSNGAVVKHTFHVGNLTVSRLCESSVITAVNGQLPGPTLEVEEGDNLLIKVINESPYDMTIHWHGVFQRLTGWADGPDFVTQCPIKPGNSYTYNFTIEGQVGTLWWHSHVSWLRATVHGALIIRPKTGGVGYPFPTPCEEIPILLGEWFNGNVVDILNQALATGASPDFSVAFTINSRPGDLYKCSRNQTYKVQVVQGKTYMLRIINAALNNQLFFKIAGHRFTVVGVDASYTKPYSTDVIVIAPGQTVDALMVADAPPANYYMAAQAYISAAAPAPGVPFFDNTTTTGIIEYKSVTPSAAPPVMPAMPAFTDTPTAHRFYSNLTGLCLPGRPTVPLDVDQRMFVTIGLSVSPCGGNNNNTCQVQGAPGLRLSANMNNVSFQLPSTISLLEAHFRGVSEGVYTSDFPSRPPVVFDYTNLSSDPQLAFSLKSTKLKKLEYNSKVEIVLQNTALIGIENHPIHLHGFNFFVLAQGFGNYNSKTDEKSFNLVDPQVRNTIAVPTGGWAVIRFRANNPGVWFMHCHLDVHLPWGLAMAFEVENGPTADSTLPPPPADFPKC